MNIRNISLRKLWWPVLISTLVGGAEIAGIRYCVKTRFKMDEAIADKIHARGETMWQRYGFKIISRRPIFDNWQTEDVNILIDTKRISDIEMRSDPLDFRGWRRGAILREVGQEREILFRAIIPMINFRLHYTNGTTEDVGPF